MLKKMVMYGLAGVMFVVMAFPAASQAEVSGDAYVSVNSMYLWRGFDLSDRDPVVQAGTDISYKGFTLGFWSNYNIDDTNIDETDIVLDYTFSPTDMVSVSLGHIFYAADGVTTGEFYTAVGIDKLLQPALTLYYDYDEFAGDIFVTAEVGHAIALGDAAELSIGTLASYSRNDDYNALHNAEFSLGLDYALTDQWSVGALGVFSTPLSSKAKNAIKDEFMGGVTLTFSF